MKDLLNKTNDLSSQGSFFALQDMNRKCSNSFSTLSFGCFHTESMARVLNHCIYHFSKFYSIRHGRVVDIIASFLK